MKYVLKNLKIFNGHSFDFGNIAVDDGIIVSVDSSFTPSDDYEIIECGGLAAFPGFADVHVHLREPGFSYKETIETGTKAAAHGGFTAVCAMPNLNPVPDSAEHLQVQLDAIEKSAVIDVFPYAAITIGEKGETLADLEGLAQKTVAFSDDGKGVQNENMMLSAMKKAAALGKIIAAHCEDEALLHGGCIHAGEFAKAHDIPGIVSESEWGPIKRDIELIKKAGCAYHVCHVSAKESVELIRKAKAEGVNITCETAPHYLVYCDADLQDDDRFRMNPPIRETADRDALVAGILDGTIDMIATDHAPHSAEEKSKGLRGSLNGIVGIETSFPVMYTHFVKTGKLTLESLIKLMSTNPRTRFNLGGGEIKKGARADFTVFDLDEEYEIDTKDFVSMGKSSPFTGLRVFGKCKFTACGNKIAWREI